MREVLLVAALQSGALLLAVWAIFRAFPAIPANAKAWIWRLAFLKPVACLVPFAAVTLHVLPAEPVVSASSVNLKPVPMRAIQLSAPVEPSPSFDPWLVLWLAGAVAVGSRGVWGWARANRVAQFADPITEPAYLWMLENLTKQAGISRSIDLLSSPGLESAMLLSGRRAVIVLPQATLEAGSSDDVRLMLAHEVAHLARHDLPWFGLIWLVQAGFFFNPVVWLAARASRLDHESATDRYAAELAAVPVQTYADMLLRATVVARTSLVPGILPMAEPYRTIHQRLEAMKHFNNKPSRWRQTAIGLLALATAGLLPAYQLAQAEPPQVKLAKPAVKKVGVKEKEKAVKKNKKALKPAKVKAASEKKASKNVEWNFPDPIKGGFAKPKAEEGSDQAGASASRFENGTATGGVSGQNELPSMAEFTKNFEAMAGGMSGRGGQSSSGGFSSGSSSSSSSASSSSNASSGSSNSSGQSSGSDSGGGGGQESSRRSSNGSGPSGNQNSNTNSGQNQSSSSSGTLNVSIDPKSTQVSFEFNRYDAPTALRSLLQNTGKKFRIEKDVQGILTVTGKDLSFDSALQTLLRSANAQMKMEKGVFVISAKRP
jgi:beta-lactamase regulating signal transducer with metallopeptidase domain